MIFTNKYVTLTAVVSSWQSSDVWLQHVQVRQMWDSSIIAVLSLYVVFSRHLYSDKAADRRLTLIKYEPFLLLFGFSILRVLRLLLQLSSLCLTICSTTHMASYLTWIQHIRNVSSWDPGYFSAVGALLPYQVSGLLVFQSQTGCTN